MYVIPVSIRRLLFLGLLLNCTNTVALESQVDPATSARMMAQRFMIVDTHIDVPIRLYEKWEDVTEKTAGGDFDYERARRGGLDISFMSIYTPAGMEATGGTFHMANQLIDSMEALVGRAPEKFAMVADTAEAMKAKQLGQIGLALGMENGAPIEGKLENLQFFHDRGIRYITLAHSLSNHISDSSYDEKRPWGGLSPFGREVVAEMNRLGIMIDVSHISDEAFFQVLELSTVPVVASHSSARKFTPGFERNMSDEMIRALAKNGGVIQINFGSSFLTPEARQWYTLMGEARTAWMESTGEKAYGDAATAWELAYRAENPLPFATLSQAVDHFDHVIGLVGHDHVGVGSDYDGVGDSLPDGLKDVSTYPALIEEFLRRDYSMEQIEAILGGNVMRVWRKVENHAEASGATSSDAIFQ